MTNEPDDRRGIVLLFGAAALFSVMSLLVKTGGETMPVEMLILARGIVTLVISLGWLRFRKIPIWGNDKRFLVLRGLFGLGGLSCFFFAVTQLPLAEVTLIHYLNPVFTALLAAWLLHERIGARVAVAIAVCLVGTALVARPDFAGAAGEPLSHVGVAAALGGAVFSACAYVTVRKLSRTDDPNVIVFYFPLVAVPATLPFALRAWVWPTPTGWLLLLGIGVTTQLAQVLITRGIALVPAGRATSVGYVQVAFAALWGYLFFGSTPHATTYVGGALIVVATLSLMRRKASKTGAPAR